jgi:hypothetical protein
VAVVETQLAVLQGRCELAVVVAENFGLDETGPLAHTSTP